MHEVTVDLSDFAWNALIGEAERQEVELEALLVHAAMYYLADLDSGRVAAQVPAIDAGDAIDAGERVG